MGTAAPACLVKHRSTVHEKLNQSQATAPPRSALPPTCSGISTSTSFFPVPQYCSLKIISGFASSSGVLCSLPSSRGLNILFLFAFLTTRCLSQASRKLSDESKSGFSSLCVQAGALAQPLQPLFLQADLEASNFTAFPQHRRGRKA